MRVCVCVCWGFPEQVHHCLELHTKEEKIISISSSDVVSLTAELQTDIKSNPAT